HGAIENLEAAGGRRVGKSERGAGSRRVSGRQAGYGSTSGRCDGGSLYHKPIVRGSNIRGRAPRHRQGEI
nr:hypothetical protein [Tanacetum cinerariifolium]